MTAYSYDAMGRTVETLTSTPSSLTTGAVYSTFALYDLAGNMTDLTYPSGRHIQQDWNGGGHLASAWDQTSGAPSTVYLSGPTAQGSSCPSGSPASSCVGYYPSGAVSASTYGNGVTQTLTINSRLQPTGAAASWSFNGSTVNLLNRQAYYTSANCGTQLPNNGNIYSIVDNLHVGLTQGFCYDGLNRIVQASRSDGAYNHTYNYDSFGNMVVKDNLASNSIAYSIDPSTNRLLRSHDGGVTWGDYVYDATGTLTQSSDGIWPTVTASHNAMGQIVSVDSGAVAYLYGADDQRISKQVGSGTTEYIYFNGQPISERDQNGNWTDYIYAGGQKIARAEASENVLTISGVVAQINDYTWFPVSSNAGLTGYTVANGDKLMWRQRQHGVAQGGVAFDTDQAASSFWTTTGTVVDQNGQQAASDKSGSEQWHWRVIDLSPEAGNHLAQMYVGIPGGATGSGAWSIDYADWSLYSAATQQFIPILNEAKSIGLTWWGSSDVTNVNWGIAPVSTGADGASVAHYYIDDHLGSTQMELSSGGWPVWSGQFTPFGQEIVNGQVQNTTLGPQNGDGTNMHYKFTGKERDSESGLDYFGARYYASNVGRWMSPDWAQRPEAVPYSSLDNPQSLNLYEYVGNNPLSRADADGHCDTCKRFLTALKNTLRVSGSAGSGVEVSGSISGLKVTAGASTKTTVTKTPFGNKPLQVESAIEKGVKVQAGTKTLDLGQKTPIGENQSTTELKAGESGEHQSIQLSTDGSVPVVGASAGVGPLLVGVEVSISAKDAMTVLQTAAPALKEALQEMMGNVLTSSPGPSPSSTLVERAQDYTNSH